MTEVSEHIRVNII